MTPREKIKKVIDTHFLNTKKYLEDVKQLLADYPDETRSYFKECNQNPTSLFQDALEF